MIGDLIFGIRQHHAAHAMALHAQAAGDVDGAATALHPLGHNHRDRHAADADCGNGDQR